MVGGSFTAATVKTKLLLALICPSFTVSVIVAENEQGRGDSQVSLNNIPHRPAETESKYNYQSSTLQEIELLNPTILNQFKIAYDLRYW